MTSAEAILLRMIEAAGRSTFVPKTAPRYSDWPSSKPHALAVDLVNKGHLTDDGGQFFGLALGPAPVAETPDWTWLPNAILDGAGGEVPPVELLRQTQDVQALRLFIDLYHAQSLARDGGLHWREIRQEYDRHKVGEAGSLTVWGFARGTLRSWLGRAFATPHVDATDKEAPARMLWSRLATLRSLGLVEYVAHVIEADNDEASVMYAYGAGEGEPAERSVGEAAHRAGTALLTPGQASWAADRKLWLLPVPHHIAGVQLVGLLRLRYRAQTTATAEWHGGMAECAKLASRFLEMAEEAERSQGLATSMVDQRDVNGISMGYQRLG